MKAEAEIRHVHDVLLHALVGRGGLDIHEEDQRTFRAALYAVCWVLDVAGGESFAENLANIKAAFTANGYVLVNKETKDGHPE